MAVNDEPDENGVVAGRIAVFTSDLDRDQYPLATRIWGFALGWLIITAIPAALVSARTLPFSLGLMAVITLTTSLIRGRTGHIFPHVRMASLSAAAFLGFAALSSLWAEVPWQTLEKSGLAALMVLACGYIARSYLHEPRHNALHLAEALWMGLAIGLVYFLIEILTDQAIKIFVYNALQIRTGVLRPPQFFTWAGDKLIAISPVDLTRNTSSVTLMLWPALLAARASAPHALTLIAPLFIFALAAVVVILSPHETSKMALVFGGMTFVLCRYSLKLAVRTVIIVWLLACFAVVPVSLAIYRMGLSQASWIQPTAKHRIAIWNHTAEQVLKAPFAGAGGNMMYAMPALMGEVNLDSNDNTSKIPEGYKITHAHNIYLQTWYELGVIGATILALIGLSVLDRIRRLGRKFASYGLATFVSAASVAGSSYGIWQIWFMALFAYTVIMFAIAYRAAIGRKSIPENIVGSRRVKRRYVQA